MHQGDSTFIITPNRKTILIDGGDNEKSDCGKNVVAPYILKNGFTCVDYVIVSHGDSDHIGGLFYVLENLNVKNVVISYQPEENRNIQKLIEIVNRKKQNLILVNKGDRLNIEENLYIDIVLPNKNSFIKPNAINNNSIVCKLVYNNFSMLFTGDIEEVAEKQILLEYKGNEDSFRSDILKVAHHGSNTSTTQNFLNIVKPKISLIGVEEGNSFGHPSPEVIERLEEFNILVYRTDMNGEIIVDVDENGEVGGIKNIIK